MKARFEMDHTVGPSDCDRRARMSIPAAFDCFMDIASIHAEKLGIGAQFMMETGMFWLTAKTRIRFLKRPGMLEDIKIATWPLRPRGVQTIRDYTMTSGDGEVLCEGKTQWAVLNTKTGGLVKIDDVFPSDLDLCEEKVLDEPFQRINEDIADCEKYASYTVRSVDIDLGGHMNNVAYVRALFGTFTSGELEELDIEDCEVTYKHSLYEGDTMTFYRRTGAEGLEIIAKNMKGETVILARLK